MVSLARELGDDALLDVDHCCELVGGHEVLGNRGIDAHAARVGTEVAVERALVVLSRCERDHGLAVGEREQRALGAVEHLLDHDGGPCIAERTGEALAHALERLLGGLCHDHALAGRKAVGLDDDGGSDALHVLEAGLLVGEAAVGGSGHAGTAHDLLGKLLGALHLGRVPVGAKAGDASGADRVGNACHERRLGANDNEPDAMVARPCGNLGGRVLVKGHHLGEPVHAAVAGGNVEPAGARRLGELDEERVLAPARAQEQDVDLLVCHGYLHLLAPRGRIRFLF